MENENELDALYYGFIEEEVENNKLSLPMFIEEYVKSATEVSKYNHVPAALTAFVLLGQICKDKVALVSGRRIEDTRIPFLWMQTSGTGKSEMYNFFGPVARKSFQILNEKYRTDFSIFDITETTDAALIGSLKQEEQIIEDEDGNRKKIYVDVPIKGALEGNGLIVYDEFEYSGVFKQSQHRENVVLYLNTLMNSLHGQNWKITKKLKDGDEPITCLSRRSPYATSYIPEGLTKVISEKGVLQRMLIFIWEVPQHIQDEIRESVIRDVGTKIDSVAPINKYANGFIKIYEALDEKYQEVGENSELVLKYSENFTDALMREFWSMKNYIANSRPEVLSIAGNFITRMNNHLVRMAVLCCIAEAPSIKDKDKRYIVNTKHVIQASSLIRQCYKSLVSWLDVALKVQKKTLEDRANVGAFRESYQELKDKDGWVSKTRLFAKVREKTGKHDSTLYKWWQTIEERFDTKRIAKRVYVKLTEESK
tara:strand:- start:7328 stop:8770 length:1443 start_codon:yes stop_codon:yes gene_type:complete